MKVKIETLSPVHIGTGIKYNKMEFFPTVDKNKRKIAIVRSDTDKILEEIYSNSNKDINKTFFKYLEDDRYLQDFRNNFLKKHDSELNVRIGRMHSYYSYIDRVHYDELNGNIKSRNFFNGISENIKIVDISSKGKNKPYIPGSSIKGAISNSITYNFMDINSFKKSANQNTRNLKSQKRSLTNHLKIDELNEMMKYIQISDSTPIDNSQIYKTRSIGTGRNTTSFLETIPQSNKILKKNNFLEIDINNFNNIDEDTSQNMFFAALNKNNYLETIFKSIYNFSKDIIKHELIFSEENNLLNMKKFYLNIEKSNEKNSPCMNLGHGSGFLSMGILLKLKKDDEDTFDRIRRSFNLGKKYEYDFPKTRRLTYKEDIPLGWIKLTSNNG